MAYKRGSCFNMQGKIWRKSAGSFIALAPFVLIALMGFATLAVDLGMMRVANAQLQIATDSAALAAANDLQNGTQESATTAAQNMINSNTILNDLTASDVVVTYGNWDTNSRTFTASNTSPDTVRVTASVTPPLFFANVFSSQEHTVTTESIASLIGGPRDIVFIVDLTAVMNQYSQLSAYPTLTVSQIEQNLLSVYNAMGMPTLGSMTWSGTVLTGNSTAIKTALGVSSVAYPYPGGSWNDYIQYVKTDAHLLATGYANKYGYLTLVNYMLSQKPGYADTPVLWKTPEQPLQTVKDNVTTFVENSMGENDKGALITYNYSSGNTAHVEVSLTTDYSVIPTILNGNTSTNTAGRQAAHYGTGLNMLSAVAAAVDELNANGRSGSQWVVYLLTGAQFSNSGFAAIMNQVEGAAESDITLNVVTVGADGNLTFMQEIAEATAGSNSSNIPAVTSGLSLGQLVGINGTAVLVK